MNRYEVIFEAIQEKLDNCVITPQIANRLNDLAYEKYVLHQESKKDDDLDMIDKLREKLDKGEVKLSKDMIEEIQELIGGEEPASDDKQADENGEGAKAENDDESEDDEESEPGNSKEEVKEESIDNLYEEGDGNLEDRYRRLRRRLNERYNIGVELIKRDFPGNDPFMKKHRVEAIERLKKETREMYKEEKLVINRRYGKYK